MGIAAKVILGFVFIFQSAFSYDNESVRLLKTVLHDTRLTPYSLDELPQNFGGKSAKLNIKMPKEYSQLALSLSMNDEAIFHEGDRDVFYPLRMMVESKQVNTATIAQKKAKMKFMNVGELNQKGDIEQSLWSSSSQELGSHEFDKAINQYLSKFKIIEYVNLSPYSTSTAINERNVKTYYPESFNVLVRLDIRGIDLENKRRQDRGLLSVKISKLKNDKKWRIQNLSIVEGNTLRKKKAVFAETNLFKATISGYLRKEAIRRGGYAISANDINGDGFTDLLVGHMGSMEIFQGRADGQFEKVENLKMGFENETLVKSIVVADFDNDEKKDVMLVRFAPSEEVGNDIIFYKNLGTVFKKINAIKNRLPAYYAMPSAVADFNGDGLLDLYVGFPGAKDFTVMNKSNIGFNGQKEVHPQGLFYNDGNFSFSEVTKAKLPQGVYSTGYPETALVFPHTSQGIDYDLDGDMDIVVIDDKANLSPLYKNRGSGEFDQVAEKIGLTNYDFGMGFVAADFNNIGKLDFVYTNVNFLAGERIYHSMVNNFSDYTKLPGTFGIRVFRTIDNKDYSDVTATTGLSNCGEGIGGVEAIDYNNDGYMDIYVTNGLWSGSSREVDLSSIFARSYSKNNFDYEEVLGTSVGVGEANTSFMKILMGFEGDVSSGKLIKGTHPSMAGFQRNCLFQNNKDGTFTEIGYLEGVDSMADGYVATAADLNGDGKMDLVLRNADPGVNIKQFAAVQIYLNQDESNKKSTVLSFLGHKSNSAGIGVIAEALIGNNKIIRHMASNNGSVQTTHQIHFGLNEEAMIQKLVIKWPSGSVDTFKNIPAGKFLLEEGSTSVRQMANR